MQTPVFISNDDLLAAIRTLAYVAQDKVLRDVDYRNLDTEEFGSVYESLLELQPVMHVEAKTFSLNTASGNERKTSGSYYTPDSLVLCLLNSALDPVIAERLKGLKGKTAEDAILSIKVCDPACGSGHFLIGAARRLARHLARIRTGESEPSPEDYQHALRDVISHCIYGVDINPMSVELCKVALWMEAMEPGKPLSFLDHHIQCGNSLLGTTPALLAKGIPDEAFTPIEGDVKARVASLKKQNKSERPLESGKRQRLLGEVPFKLGNMAADFARLNSAPDGTLAEVAELQEQYARLVHSSEYESTQLLADTWCAAFVWKKDDSDLGKMCPTERDYRKVESHAGAGLLPHVRKEVERLRDQYQFFHWHLAFPDVFRLPGKDETPDNEQTGWSGGFDAMLGNPPWERVKLQEKEWFAERRPEITNAQNAATRKRLIEKLATEDPTLFSRFYDDLRSADAESSFVRSSGRFPLCGRGDINTFAVFTENMRDTIAPRGRVGCIVPSGIATDDSKKHFVRELITTKSIASLYQFRNKGFFQDVRDAQGNRFCLLTLTGVQAQIPHPDFVFSAWCLSDLGEVDRHFTLTAADVALLNPNTGTLPIFQSGRDAEITKIVYRNVPILCREGTPHANPWGISFMRMLDMANDSELFSTRASLEENGANLCGCSFRKNAECWLPLYEAKMIHHYDHRFGDYALAEITDKEVRQIPQGSAQCLADPFYGVLPRYWVPTPIVENRLGERWRRTWLLGFRDVCSSIDVRTVIASVIPRVGVGHTTPLIFPETQDFGLVAALFANICSFVFDYIARQKVGGTHLTYGYFNQLPVLPPAAYESPTSWSPKYRLRDWLLSGALELTYTAWDLEPFARDCGYDGPPFRWDEERRFLLRAELDAAFFHLYGINRDDTGYILDTFPIVCRKDIARTEVKNQSGDVTQPGTYITKDTILAIYDEMQTAITTGTPYQTRLNPPPGPPTDSEGNFIPSTEWDTNNWPLHIHQPKPPREQ